MLFPFQREQQHRENKWQEGREQRIVIRKEHKEERTDGIITCSCGRIHNAMEVVVIIELIKTLSHSCEYRLTRLCHESQLEDLVDALESL